ncbi:hypothetical protein [Shimwellia blattae]|uniref:Uncharacterized protein n=1 Tax=Shimwellia blattae (strain ATCC 29907 / DSM 4481 / JCM 1650 / NBRC 105725 / CDC 9005-74) TaxID=630626 RepID=I2B8V0_SHIBC|nr:hypothetical protein [Shimwellia blattae]AFJ46954.1 hypothetical protein EBL_c18600 [Shimwellia blattae DSM 4481 = NBRC 105725]VDY64448.1 Uncharacterised protein [Shimwellia blattae]VEC22556.1 Uncharacterised protein [Shimwellia blattae]
MQRKSVESIDYDGVKSTPLSKEDAVRQREDVHNKQQSPNLDWGAADTVVIGKQIGKTALISAGLGVCFQGGRIAVRRVWNRICGNENAPVVDDLREFIDTSLKTAGSAMLTVAVSGGLMVASKKGFLGTLLKNSPAGRIALLGSAVIDNSRNIYDLALGNISQEEALDRVVSTTAVTITGIVMAETGVSVGATIGTLLGPVGTFVGGMVGGIIGGMLGSTIAEKMYSAGKSVAKISVRAIKRAALAPYRMVSSIYNSLFS